MCWRALSIYLTKIRVKLLKNWIWKWAKHLMLTIIWARPPLRFYWVRKFMRFSFITIYYTIYTLTISHLATSISFTSFRLLESVLSPAVMHNCIPFSCSVLKRNFTGSGTNNWKREWRRFHSQSVKRSNMKKKENQTCKFNSSIVYVFTIARYFYKVKKNLCFYMLRCCQWISPKCLWNSFTLPIQQLIR